MFRAIRPRCILLLLLMLVASRASAGDWPAWRHDSQRSAASAHELPKDLRLSWSKALPRLKTAWPDQPKLQFDVTYEPVVAGERLFIGSSHDDSVTAYDTRSGAELWRYYAQGPVRFAPLVWQEHVYFVADDGYLYCLRAEDGELAWRFRGGPTDQKILGNERLISMWPARGAPVIEDGKLYFAAGIWPFMGIFIHALDARTGSVVWTNDGDGSRYMKQPHSTDSFGGVAPQGPLVVQGRKLLIPGGRSVPACYDRLTGKFLYYELADNGKRGGGWSAAAADKLLFNGGAAFDLENEKHLGATGELLAFDEGLLYDYASRKLRVLDLASAGVKEHKTIDRTGKEGKTTKWSMDELSNLETPRLTALIKAGSRLYAGSAGKLLAYALPTDDAADELWEAEIEGVPLSLVAADDRLFAVTAEGRLYCFASAAAPLPQREETALAAPPADPADDTLAKELLESSGVNAGYCLWLGAERPGAVIELAQRSALRVIVVEADADRARQLRERLRAAQIGSLQIAVLEAKPDEASLPPYFASLIVASQLPEELESRTSLVAKLYACLRPYGGVAALQVSAEQAEALPKEMDGALARAVWKPAEEQLLLVREGALPGSANWTHEHADAANTRVSKDTLVKAPLGLLWFGNGATHDEILPRHGHGPQPQVVDGRLIIEGVDLLRATDIYTGRLLWETRITGLGKLFDNTAHQPGANASGTNYIATSDGIYVAHGSACLKLDPATGKQQAAFQLPPLAATKTSPLWGYLNVAGDYLVGGADPVFDASHLKGSSKAKTASSDDDDDDKPKSTAAKLVDKVAKEVAKLENDNYVSSSRLVVMDRHNGKVLWTAAARSGFRHNAICIGGGRLYCIDQLSSAQISRLKRRGETATTPPQLIAFDLATGNKVWSTEADVFGTWLSYSEERDVLVEAGRTARDTLTDESKGMRAYRGATGSVLWTEMKYNGPAMIHHDTILMAGNACHLLTGAKRMREHPLTDELVEWTWSRNYGCNTPMASEHLLTFRSGAAGYLDFCSDGGTGNFGGFRSSCTNNLIVAGGILSAPEYTRTCTCSYQNQASLALVPMADVETWTSFGTSASKAPIRSVGINLGAPGDRKADNGTLWLEYPSVGGSSPVVPIRIEPEKPAWFRRHSSQLEGAALPWVAASGARGLQSLRIKLGEENSEPRRYTLRLHFTEPDDVSPGERVFDVRAQGREVLSALDVVAETGGRHRELIKEIRGVRVTDELVLKFSAAANAKLKEAVLCGIEIQAEGW